MSKKLLMLASTISPRWGSEGAVGWIWLANVPEGWRTTLITHRHCIAEVKWGLSSGHHLPSLESTECPDSAWTYMPKHSLARRVNEWLKFAYNLKSFRSKAEEIARYKRFDVLHQTTIASWMCGMPSHRMEIPTVWGPIGGGEVFPWAYAGEISIQSCFFEGSRTIARFISRFRSSVLSAIRSVDVIIATNTQTEALLRSLGRVKPIIRQPMVVTQDKVEKITAEDCSKVSDRFEIISGGSVEGRKGAALTIRALKELKTRGINFQYTITGHGIELNSLRRMAVECGISDNIVFETNLDTTAYIRKLSKAHVFCFPSLRDNSPVTLLEAMAARCVPVVLGNGGPAEVVDSQCGFVLPLESPTKTIQQLTDCLAMLWKERDLRETLSFNCRRKVHNDYLDTKIPRVMAEAYSAAIDQRAQHH